MWEHCKNKIRCLRWIYLHFKVLYAYVDQLWKKIKIKCFTSHILYSYMDITISESAIEGFLFFQNSTILMVFYYIGVLGPKFVHYCGVFHYFDVHYFGVLLYAKTVCMFNFCNKLSKHQNKAELVSSPIYIGLTK